MERMRAAAGHVLLSWVVLFGLLLSSIWLSLFLASQGYNDVLVVSGVILSYGVLLFAIQRVWAFNEDWRGWRSVLRTDLLHTAFSNIIPNAIMRALIFGFLFKGSVILTTWLGFDLWPHGIPFVAQFAFAALISDLGFYWAHRMMHEQSWLWPVHAVHHSSDRMYVLASARNHPINTILTYGIQTIPLILLGAPISVLMAVSIFTTVMGMIQHSNIDLRLGIFTYVFCGPNVHRLHHSVNYEESMHNFGSNLTVWDHLFGTWQYPETSQIRVGLPDWKHGQKFLPHIWSPFRKRKS